MRSEEYGEYNGGSEAFQLGDEDLLMGTIALSRTEYRHAADFDNLVKFKVENAMAAILVKAKAVWGDRP